MKRRKGGFCFVPQNVNVTLNDSVLLYCFLAAFCLSDLKLEFKVNTPARTYTSLEVFVELGERSCYRQNIKHL